MQKNNFFRVQIEINDQFAGALELMNHSMENLFITGKAGTGKSTLLSYFIEQNTKPIAVLAPTGVAALNVKGETIHSFFKFKPNITVEEASKKGRQQSKNSLYLNLQTIIIDEISMVRADLLDCIDEFLKGAKNIFEPFGGVQMIFIGDLFQLPPVVSSDEKFLFKSFYQSAWFFDAKVFRHHNFRLRYIELDKIYRQKDSQFIEVLNAIRENQLQPEHLEIINQQVKYSLDDADSIYLTSTNIKAEQINRSKLTQIENPVKAFKSNSLGSVEIKQLPTEKSLELKVGAQVMFVNNDPANRWVNGSLGRVIEIKDQKVKVKLSNNEIVEVSPHTWELYKHTFDEAANKVAAVSIGSFTQLPVKLAWAITIHKSQGKTFDKVIVDLGTGSFASGQTYVALSRCRSLEGLSLINAIRTSDVQLDARVEEFFKQMNSGQVATFQNMDSPLGQEFDPFIEDEIYNPDQEFEEFAELENDDPDEDFWEQRYIPETQDYWE